MSGWGACGLAGGGAGWRGWGVGVGVSVCVAGKVACVAGEGLSEQDHERG